MQSEDAPWRHRGIRRRCRWPWVPLVPILGIVTCLAMMVSLDVDTWYLVIWLAIGLAIYFGYGRYHSRVARQAAK